MSHYNPPNNCSITLQKNLFLLDFFKYGLPTDDIEGLQYFDHAKGAQSLVL
jgi:hypothetical protein